MKICTKCRIEKPLEAFHCDRTSDDGRCCQCKKCTQARTRQWYLVNRKQSLETTKAWNAKNREKHNKYVRKWQAKNQTRVTASGRAYAKRHPEKRNAKNAVQWAIKKGLLTRPDECTVCEKQGQVEGHHEDYAKPLQVIWLCRKCHVARHWRR